MLILMKLVKTEDGTGEYWSPHDPDDMYDLTVTKAMCDLGYPPCTSTWNDRPKVEGWFDFNVLGSLVLDATKAGHTVSFLSHGVD